MNRLAAAFQHQCPMPDEGDFQFADIRLDDVPFKLIGVLLFLPPRSLPNFFNNQSLHNYQFLPPLILQSTLYNLSPRDLQFYAG